MRTVRTVGYWIDVIANTYSRGLFRPTQQSVQGWKARTSIHSFADTLSPANVATSSLPINLCYSCQTTLTSKSSRSTKSLNLGSSSTTSASDAMNLPTWAAARLACEIGTGEEQSAISTTTSTSTNENRETQKLDSSLMKSLVSEFLLDH